MELILKETISTLGYEGDVVTVKNGYARNYLLPQGKAVAATKENLAILEQNKAEIEARVAERRKDAERLVKKIAGREIIIEELASEDHRLFGSVTAADVCAKLAEEGVLVDKRQVVLNDPIKTLGETTVPIKVGFQMTSEIVVKVVPVAAKA